MTLIEKVQVNYQDEINSPEVSVRRSDASTVDMDYSIGERLKFTGNAGNYSTIVTDIPAFSKTLIFNFIECTDGDNNGYPVVQIGEQFWMAENLKTTRFSNQTDITNATTNAEWSSLSAAGFCWMNNDRTTYGNVYGALYNWYAVADSRNICPSGWHVPTDDEWNILTKYTEGGDFGAGGRLKEKGILHWQSPNVGATDEYGFRALPGGSRYLTGAFDFYGTFGRWWTATEVNTTTAWHQYISNEYGFVYRYNNPKENGFSVRCLKDI